MRAIYSVPNVEGAERKHSAGRVAVRSLYRRVSTRVFAAVRA
jgi:hypothetical protein